jgi:hypothetical protein
MVSQRTATIAVVAAGVALVAGYAALAAVQILVLNPMAAAPGSSLAEIAVELEAAGESLGPGFVLGALGLGVVLAVVFAVPLCVVTGATPTMAAVAYLALLVFGAPGYFIASFGAGMALADTYLIDGGDYAPWGSLLYLVSALAFLALGVLLAATVVRAIRASAAARA